MPAHAKPMASFSWLLRLALLGVLGDLCLLQNDDLGWPACLSGS